MKLLHATQINLTNRTLSKGSKLKDIPHDSILFKKSKTGKSQWQEDSQ